MNGPVRFAVLLLQKSYKIGNLIRYVQKEELTSILPLLQQVGSINFIRLFLNRDRNGALTACERTIKRYEYRADKILCFFDRKEKPVQMLPVGR